MDRRDRHGGPDRGRYRSRRGGAEDSLFSREIEAEAGKSGGTIIPMNGNHEIMNVEGDFRYVTEAGLDEFRVSGDWFCIGNAMKSQCDGLVKPKDPFVSIPLKFLGVNEQLDHSIRYRIAALRPDGPISVRFLSQTRRCWLWAIPFSFMQVCCLYMFLYGLERINEEVRDWIKGSKRRFSPEYLRGRHSVVWLSKFSCELAQNCDCSTLEHVLATIPRAKRISMGHTILESGINGVCGNRAIRIDVGMSKGCINGLPEVLEIFGSSEVRVLTSNPSYRTRLEATRKEGLALVQSESGPRAVEVKA